MKALTIERTAKILIFVLLFAMATRIPLDTDVWWHIRSGEYTLNNGMIYSDPFSSTMQGQPWVNHSWGSQIILYVTYNLLGDFGLAMFTAVLATAGMFILYQASYGNVYLRAFVLVLGAATAAVFWSPRPQMFSFLFSAVVFLLIHLFKRKNKDLLWALPPLFAIWGNLHAGFSIGFIFLIITIVGETLGNITNPGGADVVPWRGVRKLVIVTLVSVVALVINPYGLNMLAVPFQTLGIGALRDNIQEWMSPNFHEATTWPFVLLLLSLLGAAGASVMRLDWSEYLLCAVTAFMALLAGRNIAIFAIVATPVLSYHLDSILKERGWAFEPLQRVSSRIGLINAILLGLVCLGALIKVVSVLDANAVNEAKNDALPVQAVDYLRENPPGVLFNSYNWGGYLTYALPETPVFVDGRTDLYGDAFLKRYIDAATGRDWQDLFGEYNVDTVLVEPGSGLANALRADPDWSVEYEDQLAVIFEQAAGQSAG
ncbi:MAG: hypothetical protein IT320_01855 [Anaerolineae bacterium]|nr:hypothetical protein [Anaerolineae bacterium]